MCCVWGAVVIMARSLYFTNRKEYYRRKKISIALKKYWSERKERERIITAQQEQEKTKQRTRKQVAYNSDYSISIRAITINGNYSFEELEKAVDEFLLSNEELLKIPFFTEGQEKTTIDSREDISLKEKAIYIELNIRGNVELTKWRD